MWHGSGARLTVAAQQLTVTARQLTVTARQLTVTSRTRRRNDHARTRYYELPQPHRSQPRDRFQESQTPSIPLHCSSACLLPAGPRKWRHRDADDGSLRAPVSGQRDELTRKHHQSRSAKASHLRSRGRLNGREPLLYPRREKNSRAPRERFEPTGAPRRTRRASWGRAEDLSTPPRLYTLRCHPHRPNLPTFAPAPYSRGNHKTTIQPRGPSVPRTRG